MTVRRPAWVARPRGAASRVGDEHVPMQLWIAGSARAMPESGGDEAVTIDVLDAVVAPTTHAGVALQPGERASDRDLAGVDDPLRQLRAQRGQHRHRLRDREGEIEPGHSPVRRAEHRAVRSPTAKHRTERIGGHLTVEAEQLGAATGPEPRSLTAPDVVVLRTVSHRLQVVALATPGELRERQHQRHPARHCPTRPNRPKPTVRDATTSGRTCITNAKRPSATQSRGSFPT